MISVIMPVYLGHYPFAASDREAKFFRAVHSFLDQKIGELIIVSDGCIRSLELLNKYIKNKQNIFTIIIQKQLLFSGKVRQVGIDFAKYDWICYLDSDDEFLPEYLQGVVSNLDTTYDWLYCDSVWDTKKEIAQVTHTKIGTCNLIHKKANCPTWKTGYGHDWHFIQELGPKYKKIPTVGYVVHHVPENFDT